MAVRDATLDDATALAEIYNHYVRHTIATFEVEDATEQDVIKRYEALTERYPWLVAEEEGLVVGYAFSRPWHVRAAYRHTAELSIFLRDGHTGAGHGTRLYEAMLELLPDRDVHVAIGGVSLPNEASVALHEKFGFEKVAHFREVGFKLGRWIDVGYWQKTLPSREE